MKNKLTQQQLDQLTIEANEYLAETGRKLFPAAKADELREMGTKRCSRCATVKLITDFNKKSSARDGLQGQCKACSNAGIADHYQRNRERITEYQRTRYHNEETFRLRHQLTSGYYRAVQAGNQADWITAEHLLTYWSAKGIDPLVCYLTGESLTPQTRSIDHVVSIGNGGEHVVENLMPCTLTANIKKSNLEPDDVKDVITSD